ncbi:Serine/threonine protein phosphatase 2A 55 kDa regulatory subunit B beta isoform [Striga hermonthica]|uniref:Serine/threonine-protein phosphatase 2A 55 kDa regulatory subunit B n=1 Tax=Striga hermonthica TaxID=68872 RepID=A0A9N7N5L4_STRHE|nr:Serine/threonine protein phosphatase 2A 55 kDa regulatory subunit B beta isoform [Striga hermonthica]
MSFGSDSSASPPPAALEWRFSQAFGDKLPGEDILDVDFITALEFDKNGDHLAVGDRGGRVVIFHKEEVNKLTSRDELEQLDSAPINHPTFQYKTEFQSHEPEFDSLKSMEIEEKINKIKWCAPPNGSLCLLTTNDKTIKLWKVKDHEVKQDSEMEISQSVSSENSLLAEKSFINGQKTDFSNSSCLELTENVVNNVSYNGGSKKIACLEDATRARCRKVYAHAHDFNVNSISVNSDWETFVSGDDLRINLWNLEVSNQCFNIIDMKPTNMEDLIEVITAAEFHPFHCNLLAYSSSRGFVRLVDMRQSALCDHNARIFKDEDSLPKSFFTEIIASITDMKFSNDGRHILSRDYMNLKLWDMNMDAGPVATFRIHDNLRPKLCDLYNNDAIFDKFECCIAKDRLSFATGSYSNHLRVYSYENGNCNGVTIEACRDSDTRKSLVQITTKPRRSSLSNLARGFYRPGHDAKSAGSNEFSYDFNCKLLNLAWHPTSNLIACATGGTLFMYHA